MESLYTILISIFLCILLLIFLTRPNYPQNKTPSPCCYPIIGNIIAFICNIHRFHDWVTDMLTSTPTNTLIVHGFLNLSHGICTANPTNIEHLLRTNFTNYIKGYRFHDFLHDLLGDGIFIVDDDLWFTQRKIASFEFNTRSLRSFIDQTVQLKLCESLVPLLGVACEEERIIDMQDVLRRFTFDNVCKLAFGDDPDCLGLNYDSGSNFVNAFDEAVEICSWRSVSPLQMIWKSKRYFNVGSERRLKELVKTINDYAMNIIRSREENCTADQQEQDLLSRFMFSDKFVSQDLDQKRKFLRDIITSFVLAGKDSTSTGLTWLFWILSANPKCQSIIYSELAHLPQVEPGVFSYEDLKHSNYLHAAISESLRLFPPVPINTRLTVKDDTLPDGTKVKAGWHADYSAYAVGRMESVWGADCREFKPERWLDENGEFQPLDPFKFPIFHGGPRMCLGKEMAYMQMKSIAAAIDFWICD
ncbi:hypothetical protein ACHQM5_019144 [Ranunculus cassubicifolius]